MTVLKTLIHGDISLDEKLMIEMPKGKWLSTNELYTLLGKHSIRDELHHALRRLIAAGKLDVRDVKTGGRTRTEFMKAAPNAK